jgi:hypothetical protein
MLDCKLCLASFIDQAGAIVLVMGRDSDSSESDSFWRGEIRRLRNNGEKSALNNNKKTLFSTCISENLVRNSEKYCCFKYLLHFEQQCRFTLRIAGAKTQMEIAR